MTLRGGDPVADHQGRDVVAHEALEGQAPLLPAQGAEIGGFHPADDLQAPGVEVVVKAGELHGGAVHVRRGQHGLFIVLGQVDGAQIVVGHNGLELDGILASHGRRPPMIIYDLLYSLFRLLASTFHAPGRFLCLQRLRLRRQGVCSPLHAQLGRGRGQAAHWRSERCFFRGACPRKKRSNFFRACGRELRETVCPADTRKNDPAFFAPAGANSVRQIPPCGAFSAPGRKNAKKEKILLAFARFLCYYV